MTLSQWLEAKLICANLANVFVSTNLVNHGPKRNSIGGTIMIMFDQKVRYA